MPESLPVKKKRPALLKVLIVVCLAAAVGGVFAMKRQTTAERGSAPDPVQGTGETQAGTPAPLPRLLDLGSDKCQSCLAMIPVLEAMTSEYEGRLEVLFIDVWKEPAQAELYDIMLIPTQIFFDAGGKEIFRNEGFMSKEEILAKWKDLGFNFDG